MQYWVRYLPEASEDVKAIIDDLWSLNPGLVPRFRNQLAEVINGLDQHPLRWPIREDDIRRAHLHLTKRLRYYVDYTIEDTQAIILVVQVIHQRANPQSWRGTPE